MEEKTMNTEMEVATEESGYDVDIRRDDLQDDNESSGISKGFIGKVVVGLAAAAVGAAVIWKRHKKKKAVEAEDPEEKIEEDDYNEEYDDEEPERVEAEVVETKDSKKK